MLARIREDCPLRPKVEPIGVLEFEIRNLNNSVACQDIVDETGKRHSLDKRIMAVNPGPATIADYEFLMTLLNKIEEYEYIIFKNDKISPIFFFPSEDDDSIGYSLINVFGDPIGEWNNRTMFYGLIKDAVMDMPLRVYEVYGKKVEGLSGLYYFLDDLKNNRSVGRFRTLYDALAAARFDN